MPLVDLKREEIEALGAFAQAFSTLAGETGDPKLAEARPLLDASCSTLRSALEQPESASLVEELVEAAGGIIELDPRLERCGTAGAMEAYVHAIHDLRAAVSKAQSSLGVKE
jgi:hypothetical protein